MKALFKFVILFLMIHSVLYSASVCSSRKFANSLQKSVLSNGGNAYCRGNTFYVVTQVYSQSEFEQLRYDLDHVYADHLVNLCSLFDNTLHFFNLRGNLTYVYEYNGQTIQYSCP